MPINDQQRRAIAYLVKTYRNDIHNANAWDEPGIIAALNKVRGLDAGMVIVAAMRCAADPSLKTPAQIGDSRSKFYAERVGPELAKRHPSRETACHNCGREHTPTCCDNPTQRPTPSPTYAAHAAQARELLHPTHTKESHEVSK